MFKVTGLDHIVLKTAKLKDMIHFYCNILGANIEKEQPEFGLTQLRIGNNLIDLAYDENYTPEGKNLEHYCLRIDSFNYEELKVYFASHNIELHRFGNRYGAQGYGDSFYLFDPEGNEVELTHDQLTQN